MEESWGKAVVERLAADLQAEFPGVGCFSASNLWRMKGFYETYASSEKLAPLVREIAWSHNLVILERCRQDSAQIYGHWTNDPMTDGPVFILRPLRLGVRELDDFMRDSFKVMHDELYTVKVKFSPARVRWVGEKIWHESQRAKKNGDGSLELTFRVAGLDEIKRWVLSFGPECRVLEPEKLKKVIRNELSKTLMQYAPGLSAMNSMRESEAV